MTEDEWFERWYQDNDAWIAALERALEYFAELPGMDEHDNEDVRRTVEAMREINARRVR